MSFRRTRNGGAEEKVEFLEELLRIYSPNGREKEVAELILDELKRCGAHAWIDDVGNVLAEKEGNGPSILLAGHMDTVAGFIPVRIENGYIWGRGSVDAKGPLSALLFSFLESDGNLMFAGLVDEEGSSRGARNLELPRRPNYIIVGEPSGHDCVTIGYKGSLTARFRVEVERFHESSCMKGAAELLIERWVEISREFGDGFYGLSGRILSFNTSEDEFHFLGEMVVNLRTPPGYRPPEEWEIISFTPAYEVSPRSVLVRTFVRAIRRIGATPRLKRKSGTADMNILGPAFSADSVAYGPGDSRLDHTPHEHLSIEEYLMSVDVLKLVIEELSRAPSQAQAVH